MTTTALLPSAEGPAVLKRVSLLLERKDAPFPFKHHYVSGGGVAEKICIKYSLTGPLGITLKTAASPQYLCAIKGV